MDGLDVGTERGIPTPRPRLLLRDPLWYKDALIYELRVRSFFDSNDDGIGDFAGLASKLDYLQDLGVTAIWVLPFYPSPMRDDGYDIADYTDVHPDMGTLVDFDDFLQQAHRRGLRVITELVLNHTSDQHAWFQRARRAPAGSSERNFYVWSDSPDLYAQARIIFRDFERSNWTWDPVARAYYWHRFYSHQPDLNFDNPDVHDAVFRVVDFWLDRGVDGLRLDAVPYLYERDGTSCENLPETHELIRKLRRHIDGKYEARMLLAEANQWPEDAAQYFGCGDECHMNFHFPIMPRMYMAIHSEDRTPIIDILEQTPQVDPSCQWALFLRNHDELTLEMVTDEERDTMYRAYARDPAMRINLGIRRRLAPLVGNNRRLIELLDGLLLSLPGTPVIYYGDEVGMGDNVYLGDRDGVRTPMQWSADRNAGFSRANPQRLILPVNIDPEYHYEAVNIEAQQANPNSLLWWTKRIIALRKRHNAFGRGSIEFLNPQNPRVLAFVRQFGDDIVLVVANLSRFVQYVELDLSKWKGVQPVEMFGRSEFPLVVEQPYLLTLGSHAFYWFSLVRPRAPEAVERAKGYTPRTIECTTAEAFIRGEDRETLNELLQHYIETRPWFEGRSRRITAVSVEEAISLNSVTVLLVRVEYATGEPDIYVLPVTAIPGQEDVAAEARIATLMTTTGELQLMDAPEHPASARRLLEAIIDERRVRGTAGEVHARALQPIARAALDSEPHDISAQHANASIRYGDLYFLKVLRRMEDGTSPELDMGRFLASRAPGLSPAVLGAIEYRQRRMEPRTLAVLEQWVPHRGTAWQQALEELGRFYERMLSQQRDTPPPRLPPGTPLTLAVGNAPAQLNDWLGAYLESVRRLGQRTAEMHRLLASARDDAMLAPEVYSPLDRRSQYQSMRNLVGPTLWLLRGNLHRIPPPAQAGARTLIDSQAQIYKWFAPLITRSISGLRIRTHGDLQLTNILRTDRDYVFIDFHGKRDRSLGERRRKRSPLRDVAGVLSSFNYAAHTALRNPALVREADRPLAEPWADLWSAWVAATFLQSYFEAVAGSDVMPSTADDLQLLLGTLLVRRAFHELHDELVQGSSRVGIPIRALVRYLELGQP